MSRFAAGTREWKSSHNPWLVAVTVTLGAFRSLAILPFCFLMSSNTGGGGGGGGAGVH